jgi:hypothetical protein
MNLGSTILKIDSLCTCSEMWFFPLLVPYQDHVPVRADLSDLAAQIAWCKAHDAECEAIAGRAKALYARLFSQEGIMDYCQLLFNEISQRFPAGVDAAQAAPAAAGAQTAAPAAPKAGGAVVDAKGCRCPPVPERWSDYEGAGEPIVDLGSDGQKVLLVPCKAPLGKDFAQHVPEAERFTLQDLATHCKERLQQDVGLVINLSSTAKWYRDQECRDIRTDYRHIPCALRGEVPAPEQVNEFISQLASFRLIEIHRRRMEEAEAKKKPAMARSRPRCVVVHCTHGQVSTASRDYTSGAVQC